MDTWKAEIKNGCEVITNTTNKLNEYQYESYEQRRKEDEKR